jgi:hypothetical protein
LWYFKFDKKIQGSYFGLAFSKACQYALIDEIFCKGLKYVFVKTAQSNLQKCITWLKKSGKGRQEWNKAYANLNIP